MSSFSRNCSIPPFEVSPTSTRSQNRGRLEETEYSDRWTGSRGRHTSAKARSGTSTIDGDAFRPRLRRRRQHQRSFSSIGNKSVTKHDVVQADVGSLDHQSREKSALDVIEREISEWQDECYSGRPAWWSPASKWKVVDQGLSDRRIILRGSTSWNCNVKKPSWVQQQDKPRRAVTDSYLLHNENHQEMAHFIAIRLLGACFTLSPEYLSHYTTPGHRSLGAPDPAGLPNTGIIPSLRMHSTFRYSPSFGHQAQNTSPINPWLGGYDGPSLSTASSRSAQRYKNDKSSTEVPARKRRGYDSLHENQRLRGRPTAEEGDMIGLSDAAVQKETIWQRRNGKKAMDGKSYSRRPEKESKTQSTSPVNDKGQHKAPRSPFPSPISRSENYLEPVLETSVISDRPASPPNVRSDSRLSPPQQRATVHWQALRELFGHGEGSDGRALTLHSGNASHTSRSPSTSPSGRERRRQARERHDIHSSSTESESSPHYNTPASGLRSGPLSPSFFSAYGSPLPRFEDSDPLVMAATIASSRVPPSQSSSAPATPYTTSPAPPNNSRASPEVPPSLDLTTRAKPDFLPLTGEVRALVSRSFSPGSKRSQRRSMLSEVYTPDEVGLDNEMRGGIAVFRSALSSPTEEISSWGESDEKTPLLFQTSRQRPKLEGRAVSSPGIVGTYSIPEGAMLRRKIRLSSSGTAIYRPIEDGTEGDGLLRGPQAEL